MNQRKNEIKECEITSPGDSDENNLCQLCNRKNCQCRNFRGKCILYVGGKNSVIPRCRELVEKNGGEFLHHDGGVEETLLKLPSILTRADIVCCPVNCVSHNAINRIKQVCREQKKDIIMLKSTGLSSFSKTINEVFVQ